MKRCVFICAVFLSASLASRAGPESFRGENGLIAKLAADELESYYGLQYLLGDSEKIEYLSLRTGRERARWLEKFWIEVDPTPTTEENEARSEHEQRVELARTLFGTDQAPGWDARGEILIRFGLPSVRSPIWANVTTTGYSPGGELWYYDRLDMSVRFCVINMKGECVYNFAERPQRTTGPPIRHDGGLRDRGPFEPAEIDYIADPDIRAMAEATRPYTIEELESRKTARAAENFYDYLNEYAAIYSYDTDWKPLPLYFEILSFRGGDWQDRAEVCFEIPANDLALERRGRKLCAEVELRVLVRNDSLRTVASGEDRISFVVPADSLARRVLLPGQILLALEPGHYRVGIEARDRNSNRRAAYKTRIDLPAYTGSPSLSDIQFASSIHETDENVRFVKGNLRVVPHPLRAYRKPASIVFYFEIYGLDTDEGGLARYKVEYGIVPLEKRRWGPVLRQVSANVSSTFETSGYGSTQPQWLSIDANELWNGPFRLDVTVTDRRTHRTAARSAAFSIVE
jgi:GWxTD domain-containing protein